MNKLIQRGPHHWRYWLGGEALQLNKPLQLKSPHYFRALPNVYHECVSFSAKPFNLLIYQILLTFGAVLYSFTWRSIGRSDCVRWLSWSVGQPRYQLFHSRCRAFLYIILRCLSSLIITVVRDATNFHLFRKVCQKAYSLCKVLCGTAVIHFAKCAEYCEYSGCKMAAECCH